MAEKNHIGFPERIAGMDNVPYDYRVGSYTDTNDERKENAYVGIYRVWYKPLTEIPDKYDKAILSINWTDPIALFKECRRIINAFRKPIIPLEETFHKQTDA